jgi:hypothetical protein
MNRCASDGIAFADRRTTDVGEPRNTRHRDEYGQTGRAHGNALALDVSRYALPVATGARTVKPWRTRPMKLR